MQWVGLRKKVVMSAICAVITGVVAALADAPLLFDSGTGLRIASYRAPVPDTVPGGVTITDAAQVKRLAAQGALLVDAMGATGYHIGADGGWITPDRHQSLPGAIWLPEIGRGAPEPAIARYLKESLAICTRGQADRPIIVFCRSDCWMSWNAVQHIAALGYSRIYWYPGGVDDWQENGLPTRLATPLPVGAASCR